MLGLALLSLPAFAQEAAAHRVAGWVYDAESGAPLGGTEILCEGPGPSRSLLTEADGSFSVLLPEGEWVLTAMELDHLPLGQAFALSGPLSEPLVFRLEPYAARVMVVNYTEEEPVSTRHVVDAEEVSLVPGAFNDPVRVVASLPGAARPSFGSSQLIIRGGNEDDTAVFVDGVKVPVVYHVGGYRSILHPSLISEVGYLPGGFPSRYGRATSGVVDIKTRTDFEESWELHAQADILDASVAARGKIGEHIGVAASFRRSYIDGILLAAGFDFLSPFWSDYQLQLQSLDTGPHTLRFFVFGLEDRIGVEGEGFGLTTKYTSHRAVLSYVYEPSERWRTLIQPTVGWDDEGLDLGTAISIEEKGVRVGLRAETAFKATPRWRFSGGMDLEASNLEMKANLPEIPGLGDDAPFNTGSAQRWMWSPDPYLETQARPLQGSDRLILTAGLRYETLVREGLDPVGRLSPRGTFRWQLRPGTIIKGGSGLYHQAPDASVLAFSPDNWLDLEEAWSSEFGLEQEILGQASLNVIGFYRSMDTLYSQATGGGFGPGGGGFTDEGIGRAYGLEVLLKKQNTGPLFGWISYTYARSERQDHPSTDATWVPFDYDQPHNLVVVGGYRFRQDWDLSGRFQYTSGNPYTPYDGAVYDLTGGSYSPVQSDIVNGARMPAYYALDVRVGKTFHWERADLETSFTIMNLIKGENPEGVQNSYDYTEEAYVSGLPILPTPGIDLTLHL